jgi:DNA ligase-1
MNSYDALNVLNDIAATSSRNEKERILEDAISDPFFQEVVKFAYDPFITFGLTPPKVESEGDKHFDINSTRIWALLYALRDRAITGNEAKDTVLKTMMTLSPSSAELLWRILAKDLRCGITGKTANKLLPGLVPSFDCMLAHKFEEKRVKDLAGVDRAQARWRAGHLSGQGRQGSVLSRGAASRSLRSSTSARRSFGPFLRQGASSSVRSVGQMTSSPSKYFAYLGGDHLPDHRTRRRDRLGQLQQDGRRRAPAERRRQSTPNITSFDALPYKDFTSDGLNEIKIQYKARRQFVTSGRARATPQIKTTPRYYASNRCARFRTSIRRSAIAGSRVRSSSRSRPYYYKKRSHAWMKLKNEETLDLRVFGAFEGTGKYEAMLGGLIVDREGVQVRVGGGFSDAQREEFWRCYIADTDGASADPENYQPLLLMRLIEVEFHEVTPDGSLRHPRFIRFRDDKDERAAA